MKLLQSLEEQINMLASESGGIREEKQG